MLFATLLLASPILSSLLGGEPAAPARALTHLGPVIGHPMDEDGIQVFLGIPFAAPPVGEERWKSARWPDPWTEPRVATEFSLAAAQPAPRSYEGIGERGEDALYLNVFQPSGSRGEESAALAPVMVWFHGGGFVSGTAMTKNYDGRAMAREGVCVVVPNYRLGVFGFLAHPALTEENGASGNQALSDMVLALEWVRENAASFGGDPGNVTIAGQSSGGVAVAALMSSPRAQGLFHRAVIHSGGASRGLPEARVTLESNTESYGEVASRTAEGAGLAFAASLNIDGDGEEALAQLRALATEELVSAWSEFQSTWGRVDLCLDGTFLSRSPGEVFDAGEQANVPLMVGATADEASMFLMGKGAKTMSEFDDWLTGQFGDLVGEARKLYPVASDEDVKGMQTRCGNDLYSAHARVLARSSSGTAATWRYRFVRVSPFGRAMGLNCFHGAELAYLFDRQESEQSYVDADRELAAQMRRYWAAFCRTGDPNGGGLLAWPSYTFETEEYLELDAVPRIRARWRSAASELIEASWRATDRQQ